MKLTCLLIVDMHVKQSKEAYSVFNNNLQIFFMIPINLLNDTDSVTVQITIVTAANWEYSYQNKGNTYSYDITLPPKAFPQEYDLGNLNSGKIDGWLFRITNPLTVDTGYRIHIEWWQNSKMLTQWDNSGIASAGKMVLPDPTEDGQYS